MLNVKAYLYLMQDYVNLKKEKQNAQHTIFRDDAMSLV